MSRSLATEGRTTVDWQTAILLPIFKKGDQRECSNYRPITLLSLPPKVYARVSEKNDTQCRFLPEQLTKLFTLGQGLVNRQDSHALHHRLPRRASSKIFGSLAVIRSFYNDCKKSPDTRWSSAEMCVFSTRLHYFYGKDLPEKHHTRLYDDKSSLCSFNCSTPTCPRPTMQITTNKSEVLLLSRQNDQCAVNIQVEKLK